jgi:hypothetical protein
VGSTPAASTIFTPVFVAFLGNVLNLGNDWGINFFVKYPKKVKRGHSVVTIYREKNGPYDRYSVNYPFNGSNMRKRYSCPKEALQAAQETAESLSAGFVGSVMTGKERSEFVQAKDALIGTDLSVSQASMQIITQNCRGSGLAFQNTKRDRDSVHTFFAFGSNRTRCRAGRTASRLFCTRFGTFNAPKNFLASMNE